MSRLRHGSHLDPGAGLTAQPVTLPDGRVLRAVLAGDTGPVVVFESGMGGTAGSWVSVQRLVAVSARTVSYDRAGYGGSDPDPADRTIERIADDLDGLLTGLGVSEPVILVGHSWGGPIVRRFADRHPARVRGIVLVDASRTEIFTAASLRAIKTLHTLLVVLAALGFTRLLTMVPVRPEAALGLTAADKRTMVGDTVTTRTLVAARREGRQIGPCLPLIRELETAGLPDVPLLLLVGGQNPQARSRAAMISGSRREADAHPRGRFVLVDGVGHMVQQKRPIPTAEAILELVTTIGAART